jgi:glycosyltransferase involved in cell wall biosynthesis
LATIRVCHLTSVHPYNDTRIFHKECVSLAQAGFKVTLVAPVEQAFCEKRVEILPAGASHGRIHRLLVVVPRVLLKALQVRAQIYHFHDPELLLIAPFLSLTGATVIYDIHEDYVTSIRQKSYIPKPLRNIVAVLFNSLEKIASLTCYKIIAEKYYRERFPKALEILNYPLLPLEQANRDDTDQSSPLQRFNKRYNWFLYTGNVTIDRGALLHLQLLSGNENTAIAYIGKCSDAIARKIYAYADSLMINGERIKIIGREQYVPRETIDSYTHSGSWLAGVALFPETPHYTRKELTKFFEYMAAGLPIVCTDFPVWRAVIENASCGLAVNPDDGQSLSSAVDFLINHPEEARSMGENGRTAVQKRYNWRAEERKLIDFYQRLAKQAT